MQTKYLIAFFIFLTVSGIVAVITFGLNPKAIPKINFSQFSSPQVVANSIVMSIPKEIEESPVVFWGADPAQPFFSEVLQRFLILAQSLPTKFDSIVIDESFGQLSLPAEIPVEQFTLQNQHDRFLAGLQNVLDKKVHLLVIVPTVEASLKISGSMINAAKAKMVSLQTPETAKVPVGLVFSEFPRTREQESNMKIPCNTGEADRAQVASLGCVILQSSRAYYRKHLAKGQWVGSLQQIGADDFLFMLTGEN